jgi:hypothetical protein
VDETRTITESSGLIETGGGESSTCLSRSHHESPSVQCQDGNLTIEAQTLARARTVRLHLSDGRQITSPVAHVPARLGGPAGFYYQVVRGPSPVPVSLTEVDARGTALRNVNLPRTGKCTKPRRVRPTIRTIAVGNLPQGPGFSILGERRPNFTGENHLNLSIELAAAEAGGILGEGSGSGAGGRTGSKPSPFALHLQTGCQPHEYVILYGLLSASRDTVLARNAGRLQPLRRVRIPASLHAHGVLAYVALPAVPSEVIVRTPKGKTVFTEKLAGKGREAKETCEGEAEGPA